MTTILSILSFLTDIKDLLVATYNFACLWPGYFLLGLLGFILTIIICVAAWKEPLPKSTIGDIFPIGSDLWDRFN